MCRLNYHMKQMEHFDFSAPAEVFSGGGRKQKNPQMTYRRFPTGADAIRFSVESQSADKLAFTVVEANDARFGAAEIRSLYESSEYPLRRSVAGK